MKNKIKIFLMLVLIALSSLYYLQAYSIPKQEEKEFLSRMGEALMGDRTEFELAELTDFKWDHVDIFIRQESSFDEGRITNSYLSKKGYTYDYWKDVFYFPRMGGGEPYTTFIFTEDSRVVKFLRLSAKEVYVDKTVYLFDPIVRSSDRKKYWAEVHSLKKARPLISEALGVTHRGTLTFYEPMKKTGGMLFKD